MRPKHGFEFNTLDPVGGGTRIRGDGGGQGKSEKAIRFGDEAGARAGGRSPPYGGQGFGEGCERPLGLYGCRPPPYGGVGVGVWGGRGGGEAGLAGKWPNVGWHLKQRGRQ